MVCLGVGGPAHKWVRSSECGLGTRQRPRYTCPRNPGTPGDKTVIDFQRPRTIAGYAYPMCPHCDKVYGLEVADAGPVHCDECGKWFEVTTQIVYQSEEKLDYVGGKALAVAVEART